MNISLQKVAFLDRDGTLIYEPPDTKQIDSLDKLRILPGVIPALQSLQKQGYKLVMISNQDGLGTASFPKDAFDTVQTKLLCLFLQEGISFERICICPHALSDKCPCRKPQVGLLGDFLQTVSLDKEFSLVVGDRASDEGFAKNIGVRFFKMPTNGVFPRIGVTKRVTKETAILIACNLDGQGEFAVTTGLNFFNHMLEQLSRHSLIDLTIKAQGDLRVDEHHTVEDVGLVLGDVLSRALGERKGMRRYGFLLPMDDTLVEVAIDLGGRPYFVFEGSFTRERVGDLPTELVEHFFRSLSDTLRATIHITVRRSTNEHHKIEAIFKAFAKSLRMAVEADPRQTDRLPSTKGTLL